MLKVVRISLLAAMVFLILLQPVVAEVKIIPRSEFNLHEPETEQSDSYKSANSIFIIPLELETTSFISDSDWYRGIYYYQTFRLNQGDFLFHYFVNKEGEVYEGNAKGEEQRIDIEGISEKPIVIGYLGGKGDLDFDAGAQTGMANLIIDIANRNAISLEQVFARSIEFVAKPQQAIFARTEVAQGRWTRGLKDIINSVRSGYKPVQKRYAFTVEKVALPQSQVQVNEDVLITVTLKNNSQFVFYQGGDMDPLISKIDGDDSKFFLNEVWVSRTQAPFVQANTIVRPGQTGDFQVRLKVPLYFGKQTESFELIDSVGQAYSGTKFDITLDIKKPAKEVIEITPTETGQLNVRKDPSGSSEIISRVTPGQRFFVLQRTDGGWVKLDMGENGQGWVSQKYVKRVN